ncbi:hypothetical protein HK101_009833 [Irineochytrium annulatum]|nr:hypothetical protein HK101_009833 [Irineochytrium annulatum]
MREVIPLSSPRKNESAFVGYYATTLSDLNIQVELTTTEKAAYHRWTVDLRGSTSSKDVHALVHVQHDSTLFINGSVRVNPDLNRITATGYYFGIYQVHTCVEFESETFLSRFGVWSGNATTSRDSSEDRELRASTAFAQPVSPSLPRNPLGAYWTYRAERGIATEILFRVGISFRSQELACKNLEKEIPRHRSFEDVRKASVNKWEQVGPKTRHFKLTTYAQILSGVQVEGPMFSKQDVVVLYSSLYRSFLMPVNKTGEHPTWPEGVRAAEP